MKYLLDGQQTERLLFRLVQDTDYDEWMKLFRNENVARFIGMGHIATAEEQCATWFERVRDRYACDMGGMNALIDKHTNKLIGQCGILVQDVDGDRLLEVGYSMLPEYWGEGYATEAAMKCRDYAFEQGFTESLVSIIHTDNINSKNVAVRNGMQPYRSTFFKGMPVDIFRILRDEWSGLKR